jgi:hypothetical protein
MDSAGFEPAASTVSAKHFSKMFDNANVAICSAPRAFDARVEPLIYEPVTSIMPKAFNKN